jgi:ketosteroid isomerase-like protein
MRAVRADAAGGAADAEILRNLNRDYIAAFKQSDVRRFGELLADDFLNTRPDGTLVDRAGFLAQVAQPPAVSNLDADDVRVRVLGDLAIIHARMPYTRPDGKAAAGRYTDIWERRQGRWVCVAAHVTG